MKGTKVIISIFLLILTMMSVVSATTYYISPTGDDDSGDGSEGNPWQTINKGLNIANDNILILKDGTYVEDASYNGASMFNYRPITIQAENPLGATIRFDETTGSGGVFYTNQEMILDGVTLNCEAVDGSVSNYGFWFYRGNDGTAGTVIKNSVIKNCGSRGVSIDNDNVLKTDIVIQNTTFYNNTRHIFFGLISGNQTVEDLQIINNTFQFADKDVSAISKDSSEINTYYEGNVFELISDFGMKNKYEWLSYPGTRYILENQTIGTPGVYNGLFNESYASFDGVDYVSIKNNNFYGNQISTILSISDALVEVSDNTFYFDNPDEKFSDDYLFSFTNIDKLSYITNNVIGSSSDYATIAGGIIVRHPKGNLLIDSNTLYLVGNTTAYAGIEVQNTNPQLHAEIKNVTLSNNMIKIENRGMGHTLALGTESLQSISISDSEVSGNSVYSSTDNTLPGIVHSIFLGHTTGTTLRDNYAYGGQYSYVIKGNTNAVIDNNQGVCGYDTFLIKGDSGSIITNTALTGCAQTYQFFDVRYNDVGPAYVRNTQLINNTIDKGTATITKGYSSTTDSQVTVENLDMDGQEYVFSDTAYADVSYTLPFLVTNAIGSGKQGVTVNYELENGTTGSLVTDSQGYTQPLSLFSQRLSTSTDFASVDLDVTYVDGYGAQQNESFIIGETSLPEYNIPLYYAQDVDVEGYVFEEDFLFIAQNYNIVYSFLHHTNYYNAVDRFEISENATVGEETITNSEFDSDLSNWNIAVTGSSTITWDNGKALVSSPDGNTAAIYKSNVGVEGKQYQISFDVSDIVGAGYAYLGSSTPSYSFSSNGHHVAYLQKGTDFSQIGFSRKSGQSSSFKIDNVEVKEYTYSTSGQVGIGANDILFTMSNYDNAKRIYNYNNSNQEYLVSAELSENVDVNVTHFPQSGDYQYVVMFDDVVIEVDSDGHFTLPMTTLNKTLLFINNSVPVLSTPAFTPIPNDGTVINFTYTVTDTQNDFIYNYSKWYVNDVYNATHDNVFSLPDAAYTSSDKVTIEMIVGDVYENATTTNYTVNLNDTTAPFISSWGWDDSSFGVGSLATMSITCTDEGSSIQYVNFTYIDPNNIESTDQVTVAADGDRYDNLLIVNTLGQYKFTDAVCVDTAGNIQSEEGLIVISVTQATGSSGSSGSSSGSGSTVIIQKQDANFDIDPQSATVSVSPGTTKFREFELRNDDVKELEFDITIVALEDTPQAKEWVKFDGGLTSTVQSIDRPGGVTQSSAFIRYTVTVPENTPSGTYQVRVSVKSGATEKFHQIVIVVSDSPFTPVFEFMDTELFTFGTPVCIEFDGQGECIVEDSISVTYGIIGQGIIIIGVIGTLIYFGAVRRRKKGKKK